MKRLEELRALCTQHGIPYTNDTTRETLMELLSVAKATGDELPQMPVMLASDATKLPVSELNDILDSPQWYAEPKLDGVRFKMHIGAPGKSPRFDSRRRSDTSFSYNEKTDNFPHLQALDFGKLVTNTILDGEIILPCYSVTTSKTRTQGTLASTLAVTSALPAEALDIQASNGYVEYHVFDILQYEGRDIRDEGYETRRTILMDIFRAVNELRVEDADRYSVLKPWAYIHLVPSFVDDKRKLYSHIVTAGGEGIMLKHAQGVYAKKPNHRSKYMLKLKATNSCDAFITGFTPGAQGTAYENLIGSLEVSVKDFQGNNVAIASVQPGTLDARKMMTLSIPGQPPQLIPSLYNKVVEIHFQELTKRQRGRHAVLIRFRPDKTPDDCNITQIRQEM